MNEETRLSLLKISMAMNKDNGALPPIGIVSSADGRSCTLIREGEKVEIKDGMHYEPLMTAVHLVYKNRNLGKPFTNVRDFWFMNRADAIASLRHWYDSLHTRLWHLGKEIIRESFGERRHSSYLVGALVETEGETWIGVADFKVLCEGEKEICVDENPPIPAK